MNNKYLFEQAINIIHTEIRRVNVKGEITDVYGSTPEGYDPFRTDAQFLKDTLGREAKPLPDIFHENEMIYYCVISLEDGDKILIGPVQPMRNESNIQFMVRRHRIKDDRAYKIPHCEMGAFINGITLLYHLLTGNELYPGDLCKANGISEQTMYSANRMVSSIVFSYREAETPHNPYAHEVRKLESIQHGDIPLLEECQKEVWAGEIGRLADNPLRQAKNLSIIVTVLASRAAIKGGLNPELAFSMADGYIMKMEEMNDIIQIDAFTRHAETEFARAVKELSGTQKVNPLVERAKEYIFAHLHDKISLGDIARALRVNRDYLSALFSETEGVPLSRYICAEKINLSKNLLRFSEYEIGEIANYLSFCSQSHFGRCFKKMTGLTPGSYRKQNSR